MAQNDRKQTFPAKDYLMDESKWDVIFIVEEQRIPSIKVVLSIKSYVFEAMFSGNFKDSNEREIHIKDLNSEAFKVMIYFLHCEELNLNGKDDYPKAIEVLKCGDIYQLPQLMNAVEEYLIPLITLKKVEELYELSATYKLSKLKKSLNKFIDRQLDDFHRKSKDEMKRINTLSDNYLMESTDNFRMWSLTEGDEGYIFGKLRP